MMPEFGRARTGGPSTCARLPDVSVPKSLYILDGHYQIYRAYYAPFAPLTSPKGEPTKGIHVFCATLFNLIRSRRPDYLAMVMDVSDETVFRRDLDPEYKAHREPPPEDFAQQRDRILSIVQAMDVPILRVPKFEADDLMATIVKRLADRDINVFMVSTDKDLEQLITDKAFLYDAAKDVVLDRSAMEEKKGYPPELAVDIQTLTGDSTDNVKGVPGIGPKTAVKLINQYGSAAAVIDHADELTPKMKENLKAFADRLEITRRLVTLRDDVPFDFDLESCRFDGVPVNRIRPIFEELGFTRLTTQLDLFAADREDTSPGAFAAQRPAPTQSQLAFDAPPPTGTDYQLIDSTEKLKILTRELANRNAFAFDTETTGINPVDARIVGISLSWQAGGGCYLPLRAAVGDTLPLNAVVASLKPIFEDPAVLKCGHNLKFDLLVLRQIGIEVRGAHFDTMIASFVLEPMRPSHGLKQLAGEVLDVDMSPISDLIGKGRNQLSIDQVPTSQVCEYASADADCTWRLYQCFAPQVDAGPQRRLFRELEMPLVDVLADMEHNGVALDTDVLAEMSNAIADRLLELTKLIHAEARHPFNIDSTKQLAGVLFDEQGLAVVRKTKTGRSTDADTLEVLAATSTNRIPPLILEYRELAKLKGTYVDTLPEMICRRTGRIHASFHQTGAVTGRLSSSDPNLQNIPVRTETGRGIRRAFVAGKPNHVLLVADYSQIELRVLAHFSGDQALRSAFDQNQDIHAFVAAQVNGIDIGDVTKDQRSAAKAVNFGIIYGQTPFGLAKTLGIPAPEAKAFIDAYFQRYPGIRRFIDQCITEAKQLGYVETIMGRRRPVNELFSRNRQQQEFGKRIAVNTIIQGSAADLIKRAMIDIHAAIKADDRPTRMLIQVHDELVFETPEMHAPTEADMIREKMSTAIPLDVPVVVDIHWGRNWLDAK